MIITNKNRKIGCCIACKMMESVPEKMLKGMVGRIASDIIHSRLLTNSKHAARAHILEAYCIDIETKGIFMIVKLDRNVSTPQFRKGDDHTFILPEHMYNEVISNAHFE